MVRRSDGFLSHYRTSHVRTSEFRILESSESRRQVKLPHPPATGAVERADVVELDDGIAERVEALRRSAAPTLRTHSRSPPSSCGFISLVHAVPASPKKAISTGTGPYRERRLNRPKIGNLSSTPATAMRDPTSWSKAAHDAASTTHSVASNESTWCRSTGHSIRAQHQARLVRPARLLSG